MQNNKNSKLIPNRLDKILLDGRMLIVNGFMKTGSKPFSFI